jgi:hypothetical protein
MVQSILGGGGNANNAFGASNNLLYHFEVVSTALLLGWGEISLECSYLKKYANRTCQE